MAGIAEKGRFALNHHPEPEAAKAAAAAAIAAAIADATAKGYKPLTSTFYLKKEAELLAGVVADMVRGGIEHLLIEEAPGRVAVWRNKWIELPDPTLSLVAVKGDKK